MEDPYVILGVATACAIDHFPVRAGFYGPQLPVIFNQHLPDHKLNATRSIYFQVLSEHGSPALLACLEMPTGTCQCSPP